MNQSANRSTPHTTHAQDEKVLACWTALAISGLARAGVALRTPEYLAEAEEAAAFVRRVMYDEGRCGQRACLCLGSMVLSHFHHLNQ